MRETLKAVLYLLGAQAAFVLRRRLSVHVFPDASALAVTSLSAAVGGAAVVAFCRAKIRQQLGVKAVLLALGAGAAGLALSPALALAASELVGPGTLALVGYLAAPLVVLLAAACRWEPLDRIRLAAVSAGVACVCWLVVGPGELRQLLDAPRGLALLVLAALALAVCLALGHKLVGATSAAFAAGAVLLVGGALGCALAGADQAQAAARELSASVDQALGALALTGATVLAYLLLFAGMRGVKLGTVGASNLAAAPLTALFLIARLGALETTAEAGALGALAAFAVALSRERA